LARRSEPGGERGKSTACGANGAGKTTTINLFLNFISRHPAAMINGVGDEGAGGQKHVAFVSET
jgi:ABC-type multidrug transport system ATPase subunit